MASFQERFKLLYTVYGLSADDYDSVLGISRRMVFSYQSSKANPTMEKLLALADYFCCSVDYLVGRSDAPRCLDYFPQAEQSFYDHPDTWQELIGMYQRDKAANPIYLAPIFLRACEAVRDDRVRKERKKRKNTKKTS